jgi:hypothetical protein
MGGVVSSGNDNPAEGGQATYVECGARFHCGGTWSRCVLANGHDGRHSQRLDTSAEVASRGTWLWMMGGLPDAERAS